MKTARPSDKGIQLLVTKFSSPFAWTKILHQVWSPPKEMAAKRTFHTFNRVFNNIPKGNVKNRVLLAVIFADRPRLAA
jgi:hypothetical protein